MKMIVSNRQIASQRQVPMCQETEMAFKFFEFWPEVRLVGGNLKEAITQGVREGYQEGYLRNSVIAEPLFERRHTGDNTPPIIHFDLVAGDQLRFIVAAKGFGAENMSFVDGVLPNPPIKRLHSNKKSAKVRRITSQIWVSC
jgi:fumarate hydratase subunit alpha